MAMSSLVCFRSFDFEFFVLCFRRSGVAFDYVYSVIVFHGYWSNSLPIYIGFGRCQNSFSSVRSSGTGSSHPIFHFLHYFDFGSLFSIVRLFSSDFDTAPLSSPLVYLIDSVQILANPNFVFIFVIVVSWSSSIVSYIYLETHFATSSGTISSLFHLFDWLWMLWSPQDYDCHLHIILIVVNSIYLYVECYIVRHSF